MFGSHHEWAKLNIVVIGKGNGERQGENTLSHQGMRLLLTYKDKSIPVCRENSSYRKCAVNTIRCSGSQRRLSSRAACIWQSRDHWICVNFLYQQQTTAKAVVKFETKGRLNCEVGKRRDNDAVALDIHTGEGHQTKEFEFKYCFSFERQLQSPACNKNSSQGSKPVSARNWI